MMWENLFKYLIYFVLIAGPLTVLFLFYRMNLNKRKIAWMKEQRYVTLHILVPKENEKGPVAAEQMFASLHGIFKAEEKFQQQISFEIASRNKYIHFYAHVPSELKDFVEGQIYAQYPTVEISEVEDYSKENAVGRKIIGCDLLLNKPDVYPIKTFKNFEVDPLSAITSVLAKTKENEEVWLQIIIRPISDKWQEKGIHYVSAKRSGTLIEGNIGGYIVKGILSLFNEIFMALVSNPTTATEAAPTEVKLSGPQEEALGEIEKKVTKLGFSTKIRALVLAADEYTARAKVEIVVGAFKQYNTVNLNGFELGKLSRSDELLQSYRHREFYGKGNILNIEELASLFHLPSITVETPNIVWAGSKKGEPPSNLPIEKKVAPEDLTIFAKTDFRHLVHRFGIKNSDRRLHMYIIGKTGTGKSTLLENMIYHDIANGKGVAVVDPHGELINHILDFIPTNRINEVVYFNPADRDWPIGFNLLENVRPDLKNIVASGVVGIFKKIFTSGFSGTASWGPRLEYILRNVILALLDYPNSTMLGIMKILTDKDYRKKIVEKIDDPVIRDFFVNEFERYDPKFRTEAIAPIQNKVGQFLSSSTIRNIVGQPKTSIDIEKMMDQGKILLLDLSIGRIGEDNSALLGAMMITKIQLAAMARANTPEAKRRDFYLYVDEFQNFATESFAVILSEARKYHLNLIMTNQYIAQVPETVAKAIFGNVGSLISFRVGMQDAAALAKEFEPVFEPNDLVNLDNYHVYIKMAVDGVTRPAFSAITLPSIQEANGNKEKIIRSSRERYAKPRGFVEEKIQEWSREQRESLIETSQRKKAENIKSLLQRDKIEYKLPKGVKEFSDKTGGRWFVVKDKEDNKREAAKHAEPKETKAIGEKPKNAQPQKVYKIKPLLKEFEKKHPKHLITAEEFLEFTKKNKKNNYSTLKAGESVKF